MLFFSFGGLVYGNSACLLTGSQLTESVVSVLLVNAIAVLSEDRFLARSRPVASRVDPTPADDT